MTNYIEIYLSPTSANAFCEGNNIHARTQICLMLENINSLKFKLLSIPTTPSYSPHNELYFGARYVVNATDAFAWNEKVLQMGRKI